MEHLKDFVWMRKGDGEPERVPADPVIVSRRMVAGWVQVLPVNDAPKKKES